MNFKMHWDMVYQEKSPLEVSWYQKIPALSLRLIHDSGIAKSSAIIDVGAGASTLVDHLVEEGYQNLTALDISATALTYAQNRLGERARQVTWLVADVTEFQPPQQYALWHDRAVFHFLTEAASRKKYVEKLEQALPRGGQVIIAAFAIGGPTRCSGLDIVQYDAAQLSAELGTGFRLLDERSEVHHTPAHKTQQFTYFRWLKS